MYEIDVMRFTIKREGIKQEFTLENYNFESELFLSDYMYYLSEEVVTNVSIIIFHNKDVKHLKFELLNYSVKRD